MKTATLGCPWLWQAGFARPQPRAGVCLLLLSLFCTANLFAVPNVKTLTGGWWQYNTVTFYGNQNGNTFSVAQFNVPSGLALDPSGTQLFVADNVNNEVRLISELGDITASHTTTFLDTHKGINQPVAVAVDGATNLYVLNRGTGSNPTNGTVIEFDGVWGLPIRTNAFNLTNATALALDGLTNIYVTIKSNTVIQINPSNTISGRWVITTNSTAPKRISLRGVTVMDNGLLALTDAGNNGIWQLDPRTGIFTNLTGFHGAGDTLGPPSVAAFNRPEMIANGGGTMLVVTDRGNHKVKLIDASSGTVTRLYGVRSSLWVPGPSTLDDPIFPGWWDGDVDPVEEEGSVEAREPLGVVVASQSTGNVNAGDVFTTEVFYHIIRHTTGTGLIGPQPPVPPPQFSGPMGIALDNGSANLYIADPTNNAIHVLDLGNNQTTTFLSAADGINLPVAVAVDADDDILVLSQGTGADGYISEFDPFMNPLGTNASGLALPTALTMDGSGNMFVTERAGTVEVVPPGGTHYPLVTITNAGVQLQGIAIFDDGNIAVSDAGNHVIWQINPITRAVSRLTGQLGAHGTTFGASNFAKLYQPHQLARAAGNKLVVADYGNNRIVVVQRSGSITNALTSTNAPVWFGRANDPVASNKPRWVPMVSPVGVAVAAGGTVYDSEVGHNDIRGISGTGLAQPPAPPFDILPFFNGPTGIALDNTGGRLFIADQANNAVQVLDFSDNQTTTFLNTNNGINQPVDVASDSANNLYVLNQGDGSILEFDGFGNPLATNATGLILPTALMLDNSGNVFVTELGGRVLEFTNGVPNTIATVANAGVQLQGIALFADGTLAVSDAGNHVIWQIDPVTRAVSRLTGQLGSPGTTLGSAAFARLNQPHKLSHAVGDLLVAADSGNNRMVVVGRDGSITTVLNSSNSVVWFGLPDDPVGTNSARFVPMVSPVGVALGISLVYDSEVVYNDIRRILGTSLSPFSSTFSSTNTVVTNGVTNIVITVTVTPPTIAPISGYYPMGQRIRVVSTAPNVYYTTDGTDPTPASAPVAISGNVGFIQWFNSTHDLTSLRVKAFVGTNASVTVAGQPVSTNNVGIPSGPAADGGIFAGIGSTIIVPVVVNLQTNAQIKSYQFRVEIAPIGGAQPIPPGFQTLTIGTNDFVPLVTAALGNATLNLPGQPYSIGNTNGLVISTANNGSFLFQQFAVVALLKVPIPYTANEGDAYSLLVNNPSATSDGLNLAVPLAPMPAATILITNVPYTVGDSASPFGAWYHAGTFGNSDLDNADVNNAFYASLGLLVPYSFSDVFNAMDAYPPDTGGLGVGGDGQIRFLDWQVILQRSLRRDTNNWQRVWSAGGNLMDVGPFSLLRAAQSEKTKSSSQPKWPWYRQALVGALPVGNAGPDSTVDVPVYVQLAYGSAVSGLQFRAVVSPEGNAPALGQPPQFIPAAGVAGTTLTAASVSDGVGCGWPLGTFSLTSHSSNFLGTVRFTIPPGAQAGQAYTVTFAGADGAPDINTQYDFESRRASVSVQAPAVPASISSDEWKLHFFGSLTNVLAADLADPDGDGIPNWMNYLAGTDPTNPGSQFRISQVDKLVVEDQSQLGIYWLTAPGKAYEVQWSSSPTGGSWNTLGTVVGDGTEVSFPDTNTTEAVRFYRLHLLP